MTTSRGPLLRVLICYAREDEAEARELQRRLRVDRMEPTLALEAGSPGAALASAGAVIFLLTARTSPEGRLPGPMAGALELARRSGDGQRLLLAVKLVACELPAALADLPVAEIFAPRGYERLMRALWAQIAALRSSPRPAPPPPPPEPAPAAAGPPQAAPEAPRYAVAHPELLRRCELRMGRGVAGPLWLLADSRLLAVAGGGASLIDLDSGGGLWEIDCPARAAALSPDGTLLALASGPVISLWDVEAGAVLATFSAPGQPVSALAFHPGGAMLLAGAADGGLCLWRIDRRGPAASVQRLAALSAHTEQVGGVAFAPDGALFASASLDRSVKLWRTLDRALVRSLAEEGGVEAVAFGPGGSLLAATRARAVGVWDVASGRRRGALEGHRGPVEAMALSPRGDLLATGAGSGEVRLWRLADGAAVREMGEIHAPVAGLAFAPDGRALAASGRDGRARLWPVAGGSARSLSLYSAPSTSLALDGDGGAAIVGGADGGIHIWLVEEGRGPHTPVERQLGAVVGLGLADDGGLVSATSDGRVRRLRLPQGESTTEIAAGVPLRHALSRGADLVLCAGEAGLQLWREAAADGAVEWRRWASLPTRPQRARRAALSPDGALLAVALEERGARLWRLPRGRQGQPEAYREIAEEARIRDMAFSPDGASLALACGAEGVQIWRLGTGARAEGRAFPAPATSVAFAPDGRSLGVGCLSGAVLVWRPGQGRRREPDTAEVGLHAGPVESLAFGSAGAILVSASADGTARVWRV